jgi:hypothetical protein
MEQDPEITLRLPQSALNVVLAHLQIGRHCDVATTLMLIYQQAGPQLTSIARVAEAEALAETALMGTQPRTQ